MKKYERWILIVLAAAGFTLSAVLMATNDRAPESAAGGVEPVPMDSSAVLSLIDQVIAQQQSRGILIDSDALDSLVVLITERVLRGLEERNALAGGSDDESATGEFDPFNEQYSGYYWMRLPCLELLSVTLETTAKALSADDGSDDQRHNTYILEALTEAARIRGCENYSWE